MLSKERFTGDWHKLVGAVKERFGEFNGDELTRAQGNIDQLVGMIQKKTGQTREQIEAFIDQSTKAASSTVSKLTEKAGEYANTATEAVKENYDRLATEAERGYQYTANAVAHRPMESVAIAFGMGVLTGLVVAFSLSSSHSHRSQGISRYFS